MTKDYCLSGSTYLLEHGVVFPAYEVAERQSLSFKPTNDITVDFHYTGANMYVLTSQHAGSGALGAEDTKAIVAGRAWFDEASRNMTEALSLGNLTRWTQEELDGVKTMLHEYESWAKDKMAAQKAVGEHSKSRIYTLIHIGYIAT
ncbi:hypothetical protein QFC24_002982 [Naganishia onofrii]|uniref:Uncharacterized protein n=1 Tax=Naganishia onofrii TaxID=1851511 RepID=A0ACC2XM27_9TREE|nr:hypothetical protein QFC24_002982 [Naganishia onofrii]